MTSLISATDIHHFKQNLSSSPQPTPTGRQPIHTLYGGADRFQHDTPAKLGSLAQAMLAEHAPEPEQLFAALGFDAPQSPGTELPNTLYQRLTRKLASEAIEDLRIDFEDGFGTRSPDEEHHYAVRAAEALAMGRVENTLPPYIGIRIKALSEHLEQALATLDTFLGTYFSLADQLPDHFCITLPKTCTAQEIVLFDQLLGDIEKRLELASGTLALEIVCEHPLLLTADSSGIPPLTQILQKGLSRLRGIHFGLYDFLASVQVNAIYADALHPQADLARQLMMLHCSPYPLWLSDSITNTLPVPLHKGKNLNPMQIRENRKAVWQGWQIHRKHIEHALSLGLYQGWDLHPAQLVSRYATFYYFFLAHLPENQQRMLNFLEQQTQATLTGTTFDDTASALTLLNFFRRGYDCGALDDNDLGKAGLSTDTLNTLFR